MFDFINYINDLFISGSIFWFCALTGTGMFFIQLLFNLFAGADLDNLDLGETLEGASDSIDARNFKWFSLQGITGFLMMFGWTAITCQLQFGLSHLPAIALSLCSGILAAYVILSLIKFAKILQSRGNSFKIEDAIGKEAYVYQTIPIDGVGKISLSLHNFTYEINAVSIGLEVLPSFTNVKIIEKKDDNTVIVASQ